MALQTGRNSVGIDIDPEYCRFALRRLDSESGPLLTRAGIGGSEGHFPIFLSDVKARHDKMVGLVTRMMELKRQQTRAPKKQSPSARQLLDQKLAITDQQLDALVYELYGLTEK